MILLEFFNRGVKELLLQKFQAIKSGSKIDKIKQILGDFDGAVYCISNEKDKNIITVSIALRFYQQLLKYDAEKVLKREYGNRLCQSPEPGYNVTVQYDLNNLSDNVDEMAHNAALLKRNCFASVFEQYFGYNLSASMVGQKLAIINYRDDETMFIRSSEDRVTVIFSTIFKDPSDVIIGKVFIQEFAEARRRVERAPQVLYSAKEPPSELKGTNAATGEKVAYITFVFFNRHFATPDARKHSIDLIHMFRNYLHYHIKCTKAHIHMRLRGKSADLLKLLQRAKPDTSKTAGVGQMVDMKGSADLRLEGLNLGGGDIQKKTITGKSMRQVNDG